MTFFFITTFRTRSSPRAPREPVYNLYPVLQHDLNRTRHSSQNQNTPTIKRQIIHPRRNGNFTTPRVHIKIPSSSTPNTLDLFSKTIQSNPPPLEPSS